MGFKGFIAECATKALVKTLIKTAAGYTPDSPAKELPKLVAVKVITKKMIASISDKTGKQ